VCGQVSERAALDQAAALLPRIDTLSGETVRLEALVHALRAEGDCTAAMNRNLMRSKEEVEWQLVAAMARVSCSHGKRVVRKEAGGSGLLLPAATKPWAG
jgi:hypothetical protein